MKYFPCSQLYGKHIKWKVALFNDGPDPNLGFQEAMLSVRGTMDLWSYG